VSAVARALQPSIVTLREADVGDCNRVWTWNNAPEVRASSRSPATIPLDTHRMWFAQRLTRTSCRMWIVEEDGIPAGVVRIDRITSLASAISVVVAPEARGRGLGRRAIALACTHWERPLLAEIHPTNVASQTCFASCGFVTAGMHEEFLRYLWLPKERT